MDSARQESLPPFATAVVSIALFLFSALVGQIVARDVRVGLLISSLGLTVLMAAWAFSATRKHLCAVLMLLVLGLGFFHAPFTETNSVFWAQDLLVLFLLAVMILRGGAPSRVDSKPVLVLLALMAALTLQTTLLHESLVMFINGFRRIAVAPLMFVLGQYLVHERSGRTVYRTLVIALLLQLPASLAVNVAYQGSVSGPVEADYLTGTFGQGGSGFLAVFISAVLCIVVWQFANRRTSLWVLALSALCFLLLGALSDIKFLWILLPMGLSVAMFMLLVQRDMGTAKPKRLLVGALALAVVAPALFFVIQTSSERYHGGALGLTSFFDPEFLKEALYVENGGVYEADDGGLSFTRYGALVHAWDLLSKDGGAALLAGYGLGSTTEGPLGTTNLARRVGIGQMDASALSTLMFESGVIGTALYITPFVILMSLAFLTVQRRSRPDGDAEVLGGLVVLYGFCVLLSFGYNNYPIVPRGGGIFWLMAGLWVAAKKSAGFEAVGVPSPKFAAGHEVLDG
ncbi:MAG: hypothetical protein ACE5HV_05375 [Acidobacteriota bacterium]